MILQSLTDYYQRLVDDQSPGVASFGFEAKEIPFLIVLDQNGNFVNLRDTRDENNKRGRKFIVPQGEKKPLASRQISFGILLLMFLVNISR